MTSEVDRAVGCVRLHNLLEDLGSGVAWVLGART